MISLREKKDYFILVDGQGAYFGGGCIFEGIEEVVEKFQNWAEADGYEDTKLKGWSIGDMLSHWVFELKQYNGVDFVEVSENVLNYKVEQNNEKENI